MSFQIGHKSLRTRESYRKQGLKMRNRLVSRETRKKLSLRSKGRKFSEEFKKKDSEAIKKLWQNKEYREKMMKAHLGQVAWNKGKKMPEMSGELHPNWLGDNVGYTGIHLWVKKISGKADQCDNRTSQFLDFSCNRKSNNFHWANKGGEYLREISDWMKLCVSCHRRYDYTK